MQRRQYDTLSVRGISVSMRKNVSPNRTAIPAIGGGVIIIIAHPKHKHKTCTMYHPLNVYIKFLLTRDEFLLLTFFLPT